MSRQADMLNHFRTIKRSTIAFVVMSGLSILSLGALGAALFFLVSPVLPVASGNVDHLSGDWVWPAMILAGLFWSPSFLMAGSIDHWLSPRLSKHVPRRVLRALIYCVILWLAAALVWHVLLAFGPGNF